MTTIGTAAGSPGPSSWDLDKCYNCKKFLLAKQDNPPDINLMGHWVGNNGDESRIASFTSNKQHNIMAINGGYNGIRYFSTNILSS